MECSTGVHNICPYSSANSSYSESKVADLHLFAHATMHCSEEIVFEVLELGGVMFNNLFLG